VQYGEEDDVESLHRPQGFLRVGFDTRIASNFEFVQGVIAMILGSFIFPHALRLRYCLYAG